MLLLLLQLGTRVNIQVGTEPIKEAPSLLCCCCYLYFFFFSPCRVHLLVALNEQCTNLQIMEVTVKRQKIDKKKWWEHACEQPKGMSNPIATAILRGGKASQLQGCGLVHHHGLGSKSAHGMLVDGSF